jgi:hypothetical protein
MINKKESDIIEYLRGKDITIVGKKEEKYIGEMCDGFNCDFNYYDTELTREIICIECEGKKFEIKLETSYGECGSGWTTASWGSIYIEEVEDFGQLTHRSLFIKPIYVSEDFVVGEYVQCSEEQLVGFSDYADQPTDDYFNGSKVIFACSDYGSDVYYPTGGYVIDNAYFEEIKHEQDVQTEEAPKKELTEKQLNEAMEQFHLFFKASKPDDTERQVRDALVMKDGEQMSVQASKYHYCIPRVSDLETYKCYEIGFPSKLFDEIKDNGEEPNTTNTVFPCVDEDVIVRIIANHGGIDFVKSLGIERCEKNPEISILIENTAGNLTLTGLRSQISELTEQVEVSLKKLKYLQELANIIGMKADE